MEQKLMRMKQLVILLNKAMQAYYNEDREFMSDKDYDTLYDELKQLEEETGIILDNSPTQNVGPEVVDKLPKQTHKYPALSLNKTKNIEELKAFLENKRGILSWKCDGLTMVATYDKGRLKNLVTRGNGSVGEVVTHNAKAIRNLPLTIGYKDELIVRGEVIVRYSNFDEINALIDDENDRYKNPRNLASGGLRQLDSKKATEKKLEFIPFWLSCPEFPTLSESFAFLKEQGFNPVARANVTGENLEDTVLLWADLVKALDIPTDGLVLAYDDLEYGKSLGMTGKYPHHSMAFKWQDNTHKTRLLDVEWSASKTGLLNPVAVFEPVEIEGTTVSRASVHNVSIMEELMLGVGDELEVYKANLIIPQIDKNLTMSGTIKIPEKCPVCGGKTKIVMSEDGTRTLYCTNDSCSAKAIGQFAHFVSRDGMNIEGLAASQLADLLNYGYIRDFMDLYSLPRRNDLDTLKELPGWGEGSVNNLISAINKSRKTKLNNFIDALSIPLIGTEAGKLIAGYLRYDLNAFYEMAKKDTFDELLNIDGIGEKMVQTLHDWKNGCFNVVSNRDISKLFDRAAEELVFAIPELKTGLAGLTFVITGSLNHYVNRDELVAVIESMGGKVSGSVSKKTSYLINNDVTSTSGKNKKAKDLGIEVISEDDFIYRFMQ